MRKDINWTPDYEPEVGDQVTLFDGVTYTSGNWTNSIFKAYARAIGKVSRLVPDPVPPEGYERRDFRVGERLPEGAWAQYEFGGPWHPVKYNFFANYGFTYAVPLAPAEKENGAEGIECVVFDHAGFGCLVSPVNPTQKAFNVGDRVRVVLVEGR